MKTKSAIAALLLLASVNVSATGLICGDELPRAKSENLALEFAEAVSSRNANGDYNYLNHRVTLTDGKLTFAATQNQENQTLDSMNAAYKDFMAVYSNPEKLLPLREASLTSALERHGVTGELQGRALLENKSAANRAHIESVRGLKDLSTYADSKINEIVSNLEMKFIRRTNSPYILGDHLISSQQIARMQLPGGKNSTLEFNKTFLASDDGVFFFARLALKNRDMKDFQINGQYGDITEFIRGDYARKNGWLSPFIMTEKHLAESRAEFQPNTLPAADPKSLKQELIGVKYNPAADTIGRTFRLNLGNFDFTVTDLEDLYKEQLAKSLASLDKAEVLVVFAPPYEKVIGDNVVSMPEKAIERKKVADVKSILLGEGGSDSDLHNLFYTLIEREIGFKIRKFEFKVPVSVPVTEVCRSINH